MKTSFRFVRAMIFAVVTLYCFYYLYEEVFWGRNIKSSIVSVWIPKNSIKASDSLLSTSTEKMVLVDTSAFKENFHKKEISIFSKSGYVFYITQHEPFWFISKEGLSCPDGAKILSSRYIGNGRILLELGPQEKDYSVTIFSFTFFSLVAGFITTAILMVLVIISGAITGKKWWLKPTYQTRSV